MTLKDSHQSPKVSSTVKDDKIGNKNSEMKVECKEKITPSISMHNLKEREKINFNNLFNDIPENSSSDQMLPSSTKQEHVSECETTEVSILTEQSPKSTEIEESCKDKQKNYRFRVKDDILMMELLTIEDDVSYFTDRITDSYGIFKSLWSPTTEDILFLRSETDLLDFEEEIEMLNTYDMPPSLLIDNYFCSYSDCYFNNAGRRLIV